MRSCLQSVLCAVALAICAIPNLALGQAASKSKIPPPEDVTLETSDGVAIRATWYAGSKKKDAIPLIMLHGFDGSRGEYDSLAKGLQIIGHAIIVPDLRGHGDSKTQRGQAGNSITLEANKLRPRDLEAMSKDVEACKKFLLEKNNAGECNIEMLCLVGAELGAIIAMRYAVADWSVPNLPAFKQGQDVHGLILLTPAQAAKGLTVKDALAHPDVRSRISVMIVAGSKGASDAKRLHSTFQAHHPKISSDPEEQVKKQDLYLVQPETSLAGTKLLGPGLTIPKSIQTFLERRFTNRKTEFLWAERKNPLN